MSFHFDSLQRSNQELAQDSTESVLREIKRRVKARIDLCNEIRLLEEGHFLPMATGTESMPEKVVTEIYRFTTATWKSYSNSPDTLGFCKNGLVTPVDIFYEAILRRGGCKYWKNIRYCFFFQRKFNQIFQHFKNMQSKHVGSEPDKIFETKSPEYL